MILYVVAQFFLEVNEHWEKFKHNNLVVMTSKMSAIYYNWSVSGAKKKKDKNMFSILAIPFYLVILKRRTRSLRQEEGVSCH